MPSSARGKMFPIFWAFRRIRNLVLRGDEGIAPYIVFPTTRQIPIYRTVERYRAGQGTDDYINLAHDLPAGHPPIPSGSGKKQLHKSTARLSRPPCGPGHPSARVPWNDTERVRELTTTQIYRTTCPPALPARAPLRLRTMERYRAGQGKNDYTNLAHDLAARLAGPAEFSLLSAWVGVR